MTTAVIAFAVGYATCWVVGHREWIKNAIAWVKRGFWH